ncbi:glycoside hydrolase family 32 protein [Arthrobacter oryzae]|uniref:beta-fructofuranosidase n=1 Tax=Arthrobacter oryzae TaxID=409290 RepID=A0A3N0BMF1_9MICC|nr:glycoside hydrolase family 32 protein [Arthrobacter oryzae]RNL49177.1 glycoside hydrolase family 32 protein [Arthrobacter oryzae]
MDSATEHPDPAFPRFHSRPPQGWVGNPCGLSHLHGSYHVYFQYSPETEPRQRICWGHLSSPDLVSWHQEPLALRPQSGGPDAFGCGTGVVTDDDGVAVAAYTGIPDDAGQSRVVLARSSSDPAVWAQEGRVAADVTTDPEVAVAGDPYIFQFQGRRFALQGAGLAGGHAAALLYSLEDLRSWRYEGIWLTSAGGPAAEHLAAAAWECPQLVPLPDSSGAENWLLMASLRNADDAARRRAGVGYLLGSLSADARTGLPVFLPATGGKADLGPDFYAPQILSLPDRALLWGRSPEVVEGAVTRPTDPAGGDRPGRSERGIDDAGWSGVLTLPRRLSVHGGALAVEPAVELAAYRGRKLLSNAAGTVQLPRQAEAHVAGGEGGLRLDLATASSRRTVFAETVAGGDELRIFVDSSIVEVFRHGTVAATVRAYPGAGENWQLVLPHGAAAIVWELRDPAGESAGEPAGEPAGGPSAGRAARR